MIRSTTRLTLAATVSLVAVSAAQAQDIPFDLGELVIYGDRTTEQADESNASLAVVPEEALEDATISTVRDAFGPVANVQTGDSALTGFVIRGINSEGQTPGLGAPLASFYIDGVQQTTEGTRRGARGTFDAEQLEIYRGPQSTLTGRAALAGAVYLKTNDPEFETSVDAQAKFGSDDRQSFGLAFGGAITDRLAYRLSYESYSKDNDIDYPSYEGYSGQDDISTDEYETIRGKLLWKPMGDDSTRVLLSYSHSYDNPVPDLVAGDDGGADVIAVSDGYSDMRGDINGALSTSYPLLGAYGPTLEFLGIPASAQLGLLTVLEEVRDTTVDSTGLEITHEINPNLTFTSMTGWSRSETDVRSMNHGDDGEVTFAAAEQVQSLATQEFRLNYVSEGLTWVGGAYFGWETRDTWRDGNYFNSGFLFDQTQPMFLGVDQETEIETFNAALFGEVAYDFAPGWTVIAGGRIDHIDETTEQTISGVDQDYDFDDTVFLGKLGLGYELANSDRVTLIVQQGYRPGGAGLTGTGDSYEFDAETSLSVELGYHGSAMQGRLGYSANLFWQQWDDQQVEVGLFPDNRIVNAGESVSYGAEFEATFAATDNLDLLGSIGLLNTEFRDFETGGLDYTGDSFPNAPEATAAIGYRWGGDTGWFSSGVVKYTGAQLSRYDNADPDRLDSFTTVDLSVGYQWEQIRLTAYATNLFDEDYLVYENTTSGFAGLGDRRELGVQLDYRF
jgi:outer membrane receptor protein involved in Fe transport